MARWLALPKAEQQASRRKGYLARRDKSLAESTEYAKTNVSAVAAIKKRWMKNHPEHAAAIGRACTARRNARKAQATPTWLTSEQHNEINAVYKRCAWLTAVTGVKHEVDHIVPIKGKTVCGLHVPWNLQILTKEENLLKRNKLEQTDVRRAA
jgi:5-methylcytosine-specific restriction endonuclease McrA